jgi:hypothetical protein
LLQMRHNGSMARIQNRIRRKWASCHRNGSVEPL